MLFRSQLAIRFADRHFSLTVIASFVLTLIGTAAPWRPLAAQVPQLRSGAATPIQSGVGTQGAGGFQGGTSGGGAGPIDIPRTNLTPVAPSSNFAAPSLPPSQLSDPYAIPPSSSVFGAPPATPPGQGASLFSRIFSRPASTPASQGFGTPPVSSAPYGGAAINGNLGQPTLPPGVGQPGFAPGNPGGFASPGGYGSPGGFGGATPYGGAGSFGPDAVYDTSPNTYGAPAYPGSVYPSTTPSTLFPEGVFPSGGLWNPGGNFASTPGVATAFRLFQGPRFQHTYVRSGDSPTDLNVNDTDLSLVFAFPRFCYSQRPLFVIPSFSLHLWDGPDGVTGADLPSKAYSAFLDLGWESDPNAMIGTEFGVRVGVFTDFDTYNSRSLRTLGKALVHFRLSPASRLRGGLFYLDRNDVKLVPAFGLLYQPDPYNRYDIFFPQPKLSHYWRTVGTKDVWYYLAADYGGGSWTVRRTSGVEDSIDINEIRALFGLEWGLSDAIRAGRRSGFFEVGYAFNREIEYRFNPANNVDPSDAFIFRAGFGY